MTDTALGAGPAGGATFHDVVQAAAAGDAARLGELLDLLPALPYLRWDCRSYGFSPLMEAAYHGHAPAASLLLDRGFRINDLDTAGQSALIHAAIAGKAAVVRLLLQRGACAHVRNASGLSAQMAAAANGHLDVLSALLAHEASTACYAAACTWQLDGKGRGLLHLAAEYGREPVVAFLLQLGFDDGVTDTLGRTPLDCARAARHAGCAALLEDAARAYLLRRARRLVEDAERYSYHHNHTHTHTHVPPSIPLLLLPSEGGRSPSPSCSNAAGAGVGKEEEKGDDEVSVASEASREEEEAWPLPRVTIKAPEAGAAERTAAVLAFVLETLPRELFIETMAHFIAPTTTTTVM